MRTITQREFRNQNAQIVDAVQEGESFIVTRSGIPVAKVSPIASFPDGLIVRKSRAHLWERPRPEVRSQISTQQIIDELRSER